MSTHAPNGNVVGVYHRFAARVPAAIRGIGLVLGLSLIVSLAYLTPRVSGLDRLVTVDERFWLGRSANFYAALEHGQWEQTYQSPHPGVLTLWAGALGIRLAYPDYADAHPRQVRTVDDIHQALRRLGQDPLDLLMAARLVKLLMEAIFLLLAFWLARPVFGSLTTLVAFLLMALDPFLIAHDRLLQVDGMFALTALVSILAMLRYRIDRGQVRFLGVSAAFAAFAWLTRTPGLILILIAGLILVVPTRCPARRLSEGNLSPPRRARRGVIKALTCWGAVAMVTTIAVWPALWVAPLQTFQEVLSSSFSAAREGHEAATFFMGRNYREDADIAYMFYYPVALVYRLTPVTSIGLIVVGIGFARRSRLLLPSSVRLPLFFLLGYAMFYTVGMSLSGKKFDRYLLPVFPVLDLVAAVGLVGVMRLGISTGRRLPRLLAGPALCLAVLAQLASAASTAPYYLPYFNPLLGGPAGASDKLLLGWGEGMDQVAEFIMSQPGGETAIVHMSNTRTTLLYLMPETAIVEQHAYRANMESVVAWAEADYYVAYVSQWQRSFYSLPIDYLSQFEPVHRVSFGGVDFARTYDLRTIPPPTEITSQHNCAFAFADDVQLVAYSLIPYDPAQGNARVLRVYFVSLGKPQDHVPIRVEVASRDGNGHRALSASASLVPSATPGMLSHVDVSLEGVSDDVVASSEVRITLIDAGSATPIQATQLVSGLQGDSAVMTNCE